MERYPTPDIDNKAGMLDKRFEALLIDGVLVALVLGVLGFVAGTLFIGGEFGGLGGALAGVQIGAPIVLFAYYIFCEGYYGQTIGKSVRGIVVVKDDGSEMTWGAAIIRNLLRIIDALPAFYLVALVVGYLSEQSQRLGDLGAGTVVVYQAE